MIGLRQFLRRLAIVAAVGVPALVAFVYLVLGPLLPEQRQGVDDDLGRFQTSLAAAAHHLLVVVAKVVFAGAVIVVGVVALAVAGHLVARYLRRAGRSVLPGRLGEWADRERARRAPVDLEITLGRDDRALPYEISKMWDGLSGALRPPRWHKRLLFGADTITPKFVNHPASRTLRIVISVRADAVALIDARFRGTYPDVRLRPIDLWGEQLPVGPVEALHARVRGEVLPDCPWDVVKVRKTRRWIWALQTTRDYEHSVVENLVTAMAATGQPCIVELPLTPAPALLERWGRRALRRHEQALNHDSSMTPTDPGVTSAVAQKHLQGAVESVGRSLYRFDLRVLVPRGQRRVAKDLAAVVREARAENDLRPFVMRVRRRLYVARSARSIPPLLPALRTGIVSTAELATLFHLPTLRVKGVGLQRSGSRQLAADPRIDRDPRSAVLVDELGPVGIKPRDAIKGWGVIGAPGGGKTAAMLRRLGNVARDPSRALVLIDPKEDLAKDTLAIIPRSRKVHYLDISHPYIGFNPLTALRGRGVAPELIADVVVAAIRETNDDGAVGPRSDQFLRAAVMAVCTVEDQPTLAHVDRMLDPDDGGYRDWVVRELSFHPEATFIADFWGRGFAARRAQNARFLSEIVEAPRNKLARFLAVPSLAFLFNHPIQIDLASIIDNNEILILNGSKGSVGEDNAVLVCQLLVLTLQKLLHQQQRRARTDRAPIELCIDEAHNVFTASFATMLSEGRASGMSVFVGWQYDGQVIDQAVRAGLRVLLQHVTLFRTRSREDAAAVAELAMEVWADNIRGDEEDAKRLRIDLTDIFRLPDHRCINLWIADGIPLHAFTATTIAVEAATDHAEAAAVASTHLRRQRQRGDHPHDRGRYITPPMIWSIETPAMTFDRDVHVDLTSWRNRPDPHNKLRIVLEAHGHQHHFDAAPSDRSGRRIVTNHGDAPRRLPIGTYEVRVVDETAGEEWHPTVTVGRGDHAEEVAASVTIAEVARRPVAEAA